MIHAHDTAWLIAVILFFISVSFLNKGKEIKMLKMTLRLFYIILVAIGGYLLTLWLPQPIAILKAFVGLWIIFSMEFIITRKEKGKSTGIFWAQFVIGFVLAMYLGFVVLG